MKRALLLFLPLLFISVVALAQKEPRIEWKTTDYDFGDIKEDGPQMAYSFFFKNVGNAPLTISQVKTSCGCTVSEYTKEPVKPGQEGVVKAIFDPIDRPGPFNKLVTVYANTKPDVHMLAIKGNVIARQYTEVDHYKHVMGKARVRVNNVQMGDLSHKSEKDTASFKMFNVGSQNLLISQVKSPPHIKVEFPRVIAPGMAGKFVVNYNAKLKDDLGFVYDEIEIYTDDTEEAVKKFNVMAMIKTRIHELTPTEIANGPKAVFERVHHNFGDIGQEERVTTRFKVSNEGKSTLVIYKVKPACGCTATHPNKDKLEPGESTDILVTFTPTGMIGQQGKEIKVFTNDPNEGETTLYLNAKVTAVEKTSK